MQKHENEIDFTKVSPQPYLAEATLLGKQYVEALKEHLRRQAVPVDSP